MTAAYQRMSRAEEDAVEFGPFRLDRARRLLTKGGVPVPLGDRPFEILLVLVRYAPEIVSKATLLDHVWPGTFIADSTLRFHLSTLRKALGDGEGGGRYISTASGRGYCFVARLSYAPAVVAAADAGGSREASDPVSASKPPETNLPLRLTEIIGRERELTELRDWLQRSRLVTLAGPGGVGKTRLAVELGWQLLEEFPAGVWLIDLAHLADRDAVATAVASTLGVSVTKIEAAVDAIVGALGKNRLLMIFDNCEHLTEAAASLIKTLLERAPGVSILATSQKALQLAAEQVYSLDPLEVPPADAVEIGGFAAVELFTLRARAADRLFALDAGNSASVGAICRQLDGLPLALEMAVGRLRMLGAEGLRRALDDRLKILKGTPDADARHASLHGLLEWSHSLLSFLDQRVFRRLAVFPASFSLDAAIAVASGDDAERWDVIDALGRLIDRSLMTLERREPPRYRLLETLRLYATAKLQEAGEKEAVAKRHARHFVEVFDEAQSGWETTADADWLNRYRPELYNLRAALDWALARPEQREVAIALAASGFSLLSLLWLMAEGRRYQDRVLPMLEADTPAGTVGRLLNYAAGFYLLVRDPKGMALAERSAALSRAIGDRRGTASALATVAQYEMWRGRRAEAKELLLEARHLLAGGAFKKSELRVELVLGMSFYHDSDIPAARRSLSAAVAAARTFDSRNEVVALFNLANVEYFSGDIDRAIELMREARSSISSQLGHAYRGFVLTNLGTYLIAKGEFGEARLRLEEAFAVFVEGGNTSAGDSLQPWAVLAGVEGRLVEAAQLIGAADAQRVRRGQFIQPAERLLYDRLNGILDAGLPPDELESWKAKGAEWSGAEAIEFIANRLLYAKAASPGR